MLHRHSVTTLWLTASLFNAVVDQAPGALSNIRQLLTGGEALSVPHVRRAQALLPALEITNGYGPTESTTFTCCYRIPKPFEETRSSVPIGRPIANTKVYILDKHLHPVPVGVRGELHIGGDGLARGYLNETDLTAQKFIADPFNPNSGARLYKTGDLARYLPDGNIEFLGRMDRQIKLRGFRIELGEIESTLAQHPGVSETVLLAQEDNPEDKRLVAYVVPEPECCPTAAELNQVSEDQAAGLHGPFGCRFFGSVTLDGERQTRSASTVEARFIEARLSQSPGYSPESRGTAIGQYLGENCFRTAYRRKRQLF